jgi:SAM-dependent methyltransferase
MSSPPSPPGPPSPSPSEYWDDRYQQGNIGWDMGEVSPPLQAYFDQLTNKATSILIPGCGNAYEASYLLEQGFTSITLVDISPVLIAKLHEKFRDQPYRGLTLIAADFFELSGGYDLIIEQTFFCALDPSQRSRYVQKTSDLLRPGGKLAGLLFDRDFAGGPPFGGHKEEYRQLLEKRFVIKTLQRCYNSIAPRAGTELFFIAEKL